MTELLYLPDNDDSTEFTATVDRVTDDAVILDQTLFYPEGGGQPADHGTLSWDDGQVTIEDVQKSGSGVKHYVADAGPLPAPGTTVTGEIDAERRNKHRRMHTAQHVLSKVVLDEYGASTAGNQIHAHRSRIDFEPAEFTEADVQQIEEQTNEVIAQDFAVEKTELPRDAVEDRVEDGRTNLDLIPDHVDPLRVVIIDDFDICPCGGTHVDRLGVIGRIRIMDRVSKGANVERLEFELDDT